jgi:hypothetical protein
MTTTNNLTAERLRYLLAYDSLTGDFTWLRPTSNRVYAGRKAGRLDSHGYVVCGIDGVSYYGHRLAWLHTYGTLPSKSLDHINGNPADNRIVNLREATHAENYQNLGLRKTNTSGFSNVSWSKPHKKWASYIMRDGKKRHLGLFDDPEVAHNAYLAAKSVTHTFSPVPRHLRDD